MSGLAIVSLVLFAQVVIGVVAAIVGTKWLASRLTRRDNPGGGLRPEHQTLSPYPSDGTGDREYTTVGR